MIEHLFGDEMIIGQLDIPFSKTRVDVVHRLSQAILTDPQARDFPELMAMAHWFRKAHLIELKEKFSRNYAGRKPRGTVFHIAPSNVDTLFMYSWLLSMLLGNNNIVRLSQRRGEQVERLLKYLKAVFSGDFLHTNSIISYEYDDTITQNLSSFCDIRVIWGGDQTVDYISAIPLPEGATNIGFRDRFSLAAFHTAAVMHLPEAELSKLVEQTYNDALWFDQRACASPRAIVWIGADGEIAQARNRYWAAFAAYMRQKPLPRCAGETIARSTAMMHWAAEGLCAERADLAAFPAHMLLTTLTERVRDTHPGTGLFAEVALPSVEALAALLSEKDQTLTAFGFEKLYIDKHGLRIVKPGEALRFDVVWDGVDLFEAFTR